MAEEVILLYNDRDRARVQAIRRLLQQRSPELDTYFAAEDLDAFGTLFEKIGDAIANAVGVVFFIGTHGLGLFQKNIEKNAVALQLWKQGRGFGVLIVQLDKEADIPPDLQMFVSIYFEEGQSAETVADKIATAFARRRAKS